jgi:hypothetical protein
VVAGLLLVLVQELAVLHGEEPGLHLAGLLVPGPAEWASERVGRTGFMSKVDPCCFCFFAAQTLAETRLVLFLFLFTSEQTLAEILPAGIRYEHVYWIH